MNIPFIPVTFPDTKSLSGVGAFCLWIVTFQYLEKVITTSPFASAVSFLFFRYSFSSPSEFTSSSASSLFCEKIDLQSRLSETEAFIQVKSPWNVSGSLAEASSFPINLGTGGMVLPSMRASSTGNNIALDILPATNSGKAVYQLVEFRT